MLGGDLFNANRAGGKDDDLSLKEEEEEVSITRLFFVHLDQKSGPRKTQGFGKTQVFPTKTQVFGAYIIFFFQKLSSHRKNSGQSSKNSGTIRKQSVCFCLEKMRTKKACIIHTVVAAHAIVVYTIFLRGHP